jgi:DNA/RNA-binding domain of Phe-tRNA-synthetase-like protein
MITLNETWRKTYPGACVGILAIRTIVPQADDIENLDRLKTELENQLRNHHSGQDRAALRQNYPLDVYHDYYKRFKKTYHLQLQLESIVFKGKSIPRATPLVLAMFMAELKNVLLTSGHDLDALQLPVYIDVATGSESYERINQADQVLKPGDMYIADAQGILSSIIYGPDYRTRISPTSTAAFCSVYAPEGINPADVHEHLKDIRYNIQTFSPSADTLALEVLSA